MAMAEETAVWATRRIAEHARAHRLPSVHVVLHGGEPLLAGVTRLKQIVEALRAGLNGICELDLRIHTNGIQLDETFCDLFTAQGVKVGISIDGGPAANDRHRRYADGRSSYGAVIRAVGLLRSERYRRLYAGLLCTIDVLNDPLHVYESLLALDPPRIDFLLPHATWDEPPSRPRGSTAAYADWLIAIFDRWYADGRQVGVRLFDSIIRTSRGSGSLTEALGLGPSDLIVIETEGAYEQADSLKAAYDGAPVTGFDVFRNTLDEVGRHPGITARQLGLNGLCAQCRACPVVTTCGGGLYAHRYRSANGFANPSAYCADLMKLITHVRQRTRAALGGDLERPRHSLPAADVDALAAGYGGAEAVEHLAEAQRSLRRALLAALHEAAATSGRLGAAAEEFHSGWGLIASLDLDKPTVLESVLSHPYVRVWMVRCLTRLREAHANGTQFAADLGHLAAISMAAAIRSGIDAECLIPVRDGSMHLPTLGSLVIHGRPERVVTVKTTTRGDITIRTGTRDWRAFSRSSPVGLDFDETDTACWQPVRYLRAPGICVTLEDTDPYRDCHHCAAACRISDEGTAEWRQRFHDAWSLVRHEHDSYAPAMAAGLMAITPLSAAVPGGEISATARNAFGAIAAALPADPATLALLLIHEFQHVKLGAIVDQFDLFDPGDTRLFHVPWRDDPRPLEGLLHGTYAHVAVTDFWRVRSRADGPEAAAAAARFAHWRSNTAAAIETLASTGSLTPLGERFADGMRATVAPWLDEPAPKPVTHDDDSTADHRDKR